MLLYFSVSSTRPQSPAFPSPLPTNCSFVSLPLSSFHSYTFLLLPLPFVFPLAITFPFLTLFYSCPFRLFYSFSFTLPTSLHLLPPSPLIPFPFPFYFFPLPFPFSPLTLPFLSLPSSISFSFFLLPHSSFPFPSPSLSLSFSLPHFYYSFSSPPLSTILLPPPHLRPRVTSLVSTFDLSCRELTPPTPDARGAAPSAAQNRE